MAKAKVHTHTLVQYEGEARWRLKTPDHTPPLDSDGKPKKVAQQRPATPLEHVAIAKQQWANHRRRT